MICCRCREEREKLSMDGRWRGTGICRECLSKQYRNRRHLNWSRSTIHQHKIHGCEIRFNSEELCERAKNTPKCLMCSRKLRWSSGHGKVRDDSPTLDRVSNSKILTRRNTQIICHECNRMKGSMTMRQLMDWCIKVLSL